MTTQQPIAAVLKTLAPRNLSAFSDLGAALQMYVADKAFSPTAIRILANRSLLGALLGRLVLRQPYDQEAESLWNHLGSTLSKTSAPDSWSYRGSAEDNLAVDRALARSGLGNHGDGIAFGEGSATEFSLGNLGNGKISLPKAVTKTPIAIIGYGAAGILINYALKSLGFANVTVFEKGGALGIWRSEDIYRGSRNNPQRLSFLGQKLAAAPGSGLEVRNFLQHLLTGHPQQLEISKLRSKANFKHVLTDANGSQQAFPIVVNAIGLGQPRPVSDPSRMTTNAEPQDCGPRWQTRLKPAEIAGKRLVLIGLGNSTAEMLSQIHKTIQEGHEVDYRILTHYPPEAVWNPTEDVIVDDKRFRVFRDLSKPNLTGFQGDLPDSQLDYSRALLSGKILAGVKSWDIYIGVAGHRLIARNSLAEGIEEFDYQLIYTLIGYQHPPETLQALGCLLDAGKRYPQADYDGEFHDQSEADPGVRLASGYYGFGAILETPSNPNAATISGMIHRIGDLLFGIIMRAAEHQLENGVVI